MDSVKVKLPQIVNGEHDNYFREYNILIATIISARSPDSILHSISENIAKALKAKGCSILMLDPDSNLMNHVIAYGISDWYLKKGPIYADKSVAETLLGKPVVILDASSDDRVQYPLEARQEGISSILSVPIILRDEIIGVIRVYTGEPRHFPNDEIDFVVAVANISAIALENAREYESNKKDHEKVYTELMLWRSNMDPREPGRPYF
jgi:GAF domain-containing protein